MSPPFRIFIDFFALTTSSTREDICLLHPSIPTALNKLKLISSLKDVDSLLSEFTDQDLFANILQKHHLTRTMDLNSSLISSNVQISKIVTLWAYIDPI